MPMAIVILSLALAAGPTTQTNAAALVAQLGSSTPAEQAAATESLKALGRDALPALQEGMKARDSELGKRASTLWNTIARDLMTRPSMVRLEGPYESIADVLDDCSKQTGMSLRCLQMQDDRPVRFANGQRSHFGPPWSGWVSRAFANTTSDRASSRRSTSAPNPTGNSSRHPDRSGSR